MDSVSERVGADRCQRNGADCNVDLATNIHGQTLRTKAFDERIACMRDWSSAVVAKFGQRADWRDH
ncbi:MAG TPA: hypothetical protein DDY88_07745 [Actinobacteria bacterium]|nr:hypothetical protein [Actinomycetota bacterium]